jgi:4-carboxymuconolactone decarboxylase
MRIALLFAATMPLLLGAPPAAAQTTTATMPADIDPHSGFRLPLPKREELDEAGKKIYDEASRPGKSLVGLQGPSGIRLYSTKTAPLLQAVNRHLRFEAGIAPRIREIAILVTAREMDSQFEWAAHEPEALKVGVPQQTVDAIKHRRATSGLDERDAALIALGRQIWREHRVDSATFARAKALFGPHQLVDIVLLMGNYAGTAAMLTAFDMQLPAGKKPLLPTP